MEKEEKSKTVDKGLLIALMVVAFAIGALIGYYAFGLTKDEKPKEETNTTETEKEDTNLEGNQLEKNDNPDDEDRCKTTPTSTKEILNIDSSSVKLENLYIGEISSGEEYYGMKLALYTNNIYLYGYSEDNDVYDRSYGTYEIKDGKIYLTEKLRGRMDECTYTTNLTNKVFEYTNNSIKLETFYDDKVKLELFVSNDEEEKKYFLYENNNIDIYSLCTCE